MKRNKQISRLLAILLMLAMVIGMLPMPVYAAGEVTVYVSNDATSSYYTAGVAGTTPTTPCSLDSGWEAVRTNGGKLVIMDSIELLYYTDDTAPRHPLEATGDKTITVEGYNAAAKLTSKRLSNGMICMSNYNGTITVKNLTLEYTGTEPTGDGFMNTWSGTYSPKFVLENVVCTSTSTSGQPIPKALSIGRSTDTQIKNLTLNNVDASLGLNVTLNGPITASGTTTITSGGTIPRIARATGFIEGAMLTVDSGSVTLNTVFDGNNVDANVAGASDANTLTTGIHVKGGSLVIGAKGGLQNSICKGGNWTSGGLLVTGGTATLNGGIIKGNTSYDGGGVLVRTNAMFNMTAGEISGNTANGFGAGVYCFGGDVNILGGSIKDNKVISANGGGGIMIHNNSSVAIKGNAVITGNSCASLKNGAVINAGGVWLYGDGTLVVEGTPSIKGNTAGGQSSDVVLKDGRTIAIGVGHLNGGSIGVYVDPMPTDAQDIKIATGANATDAKYFFSDKATDAGVLYCDGSKDWLNTDTINAHHTSHSGATLWMSTAAAPHKVTVSGTGIVSTPASSDIISGIGGDFQIKAADGYYFPNMLSASVAPAGAATMTFSAKTQDSITLSVNNITQIAGITVSGAQKYLGKIGNTYYANNAQGNAGLVAAMKSAASGTEIILGDGFNASGVQMNAGVKVKKYNAAAFTTTASDTLYNISNGTIGVMQADAKIGGKLYAALGDALSAAQSGETVELLRNPQTAVTKAIREGVAVKSGDAVYTAKAANTSVTVGTDGSITLNGGALNCKDTNGKPVSVKMPGGGFLAVSSEAEEFDVTVPATGAPYVSLPAAGQEIEINGVKFRSDMANGKMYLPNPLAAEAAESGNVTAEVPAGKSVTTKDGLNVAAPVGNTGALKVTNEGVTIENANDIVTIGDKEYTAKSAGTVIEYNDGKPALSQGSVELDKDESVLVGETSIINSGDKAITVTADEPAKISVPAGGKVVIDGVEYSNDGDTALELPVDAAALNFIKTYLSDKDGKVYNELTAENYAQIVSGKETFDGLNQSAKDAINALLAKDDAENYNAYAEYLTAAETVQNTVNDFVKKYMSDESGNIYKAVSADNCSQILSGESDWNKLGDVEKAAVNAKLKEAGAQPDNYPDMIAAADEKATDAANQWKEDNKDILAKAVDAITDADMEAIDKALEEYDRLSDAAKSKLTEEKAKLDEMKAAAMKNTDAPQTGDNRSMMLWLVLFAADAVLINTAIYNRKKKPIR